MNMFTIFKTALEVLYVCALSTLALYGVGNLVMIVLYWRSKDRPMQPTSMAAWPMVTVQLPTFNERYVVERLLEAVAALDYPRDKLQIQVLDDSTDETALLLRHLVGQLDSRGYAIQLVHRRDRVGFKAGALVEGMKSATGELLAIFDADFLPPRDWLKKSVIYFGDPKLACVQTRWSHINYNYDAFTRALALGLDGHYIVEQTARSRNGLFLHFNGSAGIWRRAAIEAAGGWQPDTLTEDVDLSYRAQMRGWRIGYLPDVTVPAELPVQVESFKKQIFRWAKGSFQVVRKLMPAMLTTEMPEGVRILGILHLTAFIIHPLMVIIIILVLPVGLMSPQLFKMFPWTLFTGLGAPLMYALARTEHMPRLIDRLKNLPLWTLIGIGLALNDTLAVMEGLFSNEVGAFVRTPKFNLTSGRKEWATSSYVVSISPMVWGELMLGAYTLFSALILSSKLGWGVAPWLLLYSASFFYIAGLNLYQTWQSNQVKSTAVGTA